MNHPIDPSMLGMAEAPQLTYISIPDAANVLKRGIEWYLGQRGETFIEVSFSYKNKSGETVTYYPYREVADWLSDNKGRGLLLYGSCGLGKTMLARYVIPQILFHYNTPRKITHTYSITELNDEQKLNEALGFNILSVDDVGVEENMVVYGKRRNPFDEIMDAVEKQGKLIIITTNLTQKELTERYGTRVMDRIKATTRRVVFDLYDEQGQRKSLRRYD